MAANGPIMPCISRLQRLLILGFLAASVLPIQGTALTLVLEPKRDNTLYESPTGSISNGAGQFFFAGRTLAGARRRGVLAFDLSSIPPGTAVDSVAVVLSMSRAQPGTHQVGLHRLLADWGEGTSDAPMEEGGGTASTPGDATWIHRFFDTPLWTNAGGDFVPTASASLGIGSTGFFTWSSPALRADVQQWVDTPASNFGWLVHGDESGGETAKRFDSKDHPDPAVHPRLLLYLQPATDTAGDALVFRLHPGRPNPFRFSTTIAYDLPGPGNVALHLLDARGRSLRTFATEPGQGRHFLAWDGRDRTGRPLPSGHYFLVLERGGERQVQRLTLSR
jgi:flagellar hook capping protein FlgD